jgi:signal transduction histidine kinase
MTDIEPQIDEMATAMRGIAADLRPSGPDELGVGPAIGCMASEFERRCGISVECEIEAGVRLIDLASINIFRIVREALTNVGPLTSAHGSSHLTSRR